MFFAFHYGVPSIQACRSPSLDLRILKTQLFFFRKIFCATSASSAYSFMGTHSRKKSPMLCQLGFWLHMYVCYNHTNCT